MLLTENDHTATAPIDTFEANDVGRYIVTGNTWEWCADRFHPADHRHTLARTPPARSPARAA